MSLLKPFYSVRFVGFVVGILLLAGCQTNTEPRMIFIRPTDSPERAAMIAANPNLQAGEAVYNLRCAHCHGFSGEGQMGRTAEVARELGLHLAPPHDATGHTWQHADQQIRQVILKGIQNPLAQFPMSAFEGTVTDEEIDHLIVYMRLWWTDEQRAAQAQVTVRQTELDAEFGSDE